jgi:hypothetical protein
MARAAWPVRGWEARRDGRAEVRTFADLFPETASPARVSFTAPRVEAWNLLGQVPPSQLATEPVVTVGALAQCTKDTVAMASLCDGVGGCNATRSVGSADARTL